jgi:hypothetical protein
MEKMKEKIGENLWQADKMILQKLFQPHHSIIEDSLEAKIMGVD